MVLNQFHRTSCEMTAASKKKMPFLLETDDAVERMGKAIERREKVFLFPWQMAVLARAIPVMPHSLFEVVGRKLR